MSPREVILYSRSCNNPAELVLLEQRFPDTLRSLMVFTTTFEIDYRVTFVEAKTADIAQNVLVSNIVPDSSLARYMRHARIAKFVQRKRLSFEYYASTAASTFGVTHLDDKRLALCSDSDAVLLFKAASVSVLNQARPKGYFPCRPFYFAADRLAQALHALLIDIPD